ncbi:MAG: response regulator transcription factor [Clostridia bacterium]|nr:response regulator transcription factor [Clostridia bacterium]
MAASVLLVEDDSFLRDGLYTVLTGEGYAVTAVGSIRDADRALVQQSFSLLILDIGLPDGSGVSLCTKLRARGNDVPILFLTAFDDEIQIVSGLDAGGDDYITKPFRLRELLSRVRALLRRVSKNTLESNGLSLDLQNRTVLKDGAPLLLTPTEFQILAVLLQNTGKIVTRTMLLENIWDDAGNFIDDNTLSVHVSRLREKIGPAYIRTVRGIGYRWNETAAEQ